MAGCTMDATLGLEVEEEGADRALDPVLVDGEEWEEGDPAQGPDPVATEDVGRGPVQDPVKGPDLPETESLGPVIVKKKDRGRVTADAKAGVRAGLSLPGKKARQEA